MSQATTASEAAHPTKPSTTTTTTTKMGSSSSYLTRTKTFEKLAKYAFAMCNSDKESGKIDKTELYAGILLVHLNLAKYAGAAACYPPSRATVEKLFDVVDVDNSKTIDEQEFIHILKICSVDIASRVFVYYSCLILLVPYIARTVVQSILQVDEFMGWNVSKGGQTYDFFHRVETILSWNDIAKKVVSFMIFIFVIPKLLDMIDSSSQRQARQAATTTTKNSKEE